MSLYNLTFCSSHFVHKIGTQDPFLHIGMYAYYH